MKPSRPGDLTQHLELPGVWLERGVIDSADTRLLQSPLGLAGRSALLTLWFASGQPMASARVDAHWWRRRASACRRMTPDAVVAERHGTAAARDRAACARAHRVEPAMALAQAVRAAWRGAAWQLQPTAPRVWRT